MEETTYFPCSPRLSLLPTVISTTGGSELQGDELTERQHPACATCRTARFIDLPRDSLLFPIEETKHYTNGITLMVIHRSLRFYSGCLVCSARHSAVTYGLKGGFLPEAFNAVNIPNDHPWKQRLVPTEGNDYFVGTMILQARPSIFGGYPVPERYDHRRAKVWIENCLRDHQRCRVSRRVPNQMRLMDCYKKRIVNAVPSLRWVTLSYVWGLDDTTTSTEQAHDAERYSWPFQIPRTVEDAITVTVALGFRYLWCDAYCIEQQDNAHKADQIRNMDEVYRYAEFTIVATGSSKHHGLPGVSFARQSDFKLFSIDNRKIAHTIRTPASSQVICSPWMKRAWTFQEGLMSKRLLVFTSGEMSFYCDTASWTESIGGVEHIKDPSSVAWNEWSANASAIFGINITSTALSHRSIIDQYKEFVRLATLYTERELSYDSDALNAFSGVMQYLSHLQPSLYHISGLPYFREVMQDVRLKENYFFRSVGWKLSWGPGNGKNPNVLTVSKTCTDSVF